MATVIISTLSNHIQKLKSLKDADKLLRQAVLDGVALVTNRIETKGEKSDGSKIGNSYNEWYAKKRQKLGRQTSFIDLSLTGQMLNNYKLLPYGSTGYAMGFDNAFAGQKADWNEERFGELFIPTKEENDLIIKAVENRIKEILQ